MAAFEQSPSHIPLLLLLLLLLFLIASFFSSKNLRRHSRLGRDEEKPPISPVYRNLHQAKSLLDGSFFEEPSLKAILESRAGPNGRLIRAFGIDNAFTTTDTEYRREFVRHAENCINLSSIKWDSLAKDIGALFRGNIKRQQASNGTVLLSRLLQITVLRAVLPILFPNCCSPDLSEEEQDDIAYSIADKINSLWIGSKCNRETNLKDLQSLKEECQKLLPDITINSPRDSPLNLILPAFETLWRIVLRCFIEIQFRNKDDFRSNLALLQSYLDRPTSETFNKVDTRNISVSHFVNEALRLYPPTKRVYRQIPTEPEIGLGVVAADIEFIHHDPNIWGTDAAEFRPSRWRKGNMNGIMMSAFFPFGMKPLVCPARKVFGPRIIGLLVASLSVALGQSGEWETVGESDLLSPGPLENARDSYKSLAIELKKGDLDS